MLETSLNITADVEQSGLSECFEFVGFLYNFLFEDI
jgi:hypothetical protein